MTRWLALLLVGIVGLSGCASPTEEAPPRAAAGAPAAEPGPTSAEPSPERTPAPAPEPDYARTYRGWIRPSSGPAPWEAQFPFPVNATALNWTVVGEVSSSYPVVGSAPRQTANVSVSVLDATGKVVAAKGRGAMSSDTRLTLEGHAPAAGPYTVRYSAYGGSDGQTMGDRFLVAIHVNYPD